MILIATTDNLQAVMGDAVDTTAPSFVATWVDFTTTATTPGRTAGVLNGTSDVNVVPAPAASTQRQVKTLSVYNADAVAHTVAVKIDISSTDYVMWSGVVGVGATLFWSSETGFVVQNNLTPTYVTGSWTPALSYEAPGTFSASYTVQGGDFVKFGKAVAVTARLNTSGTISRGTASGAFLLTGLPYAPDLSWVSSIDAAPINLQGSAFAVTSSGIDMLGNQAFLTDGSTSLILGYGFRTIASGILDRASWTTSNMADGSVALHATFSYITAE